PAPARCPTPPPPRGRRPGQRRAQGRTAGPPALEELQREHGLAGLRGARLQPLPRRCPRSRDRQSPNGHHRHHHHSSSRTARLPIAEADRAPTPQLARQTTVDAPARDRERAPTSNNTLTTPAPRGRETRTSQWKSRADRQSRHALIPPKPAEHADCPANPSRNTRPVD